MTVNEKKAVFLIYCLMFFVVGWICGSLPAKRLYHAKPVPVVAQSRAASGMMKAPMPHRYLVEKVLRVVDGDTIDVRFYSWEDTIRIKRIRLLDVDTPELRSRKGTAEEKAIEKQAALAALAYVQQIMDKAQSIYIITDWKSDSFGRVLAAIEYQDTTGTHDLAAVLLKAGHAEPYRK